MKPFHTLLAVFLFYLFSSNLSAQNGPISLGNKYNFNLPQMEVAFSLPAHFGYTVPFHEECEAFMDIQDNRVNYFFNPECLSQSDIFSFFMPHENSSCMYLLIETKENANAEEKINWLKTSYGTKKEIPAITSLAGSWTGIQLLQEDEDTPFNMYYFQNEEYYFEFAYRNENPEQIKTCENIIKSFSKRSAPNEIYIYEARKNSGIFEPEEQKEPEDDLEEFKGVTPAENTFSFPGLGLTLRIPSGFEYNFKARNVELSPNQEEVVSIDISTDDAFKAFELYFILLHSDKAVANIRLWKNMKSPKEMLEEDASRQRQISKFPLAIDGMNASAGSFGSEEFPTINVYLPLKDYGLSLMIGVSDEEDLKIIDRFLAGIKISPDQKLPTTTPVSPKLLSEQVKIKKQNIKALSEFQILPFDPANFPVITYCYFAEIGASIDFPASSDQIYAMPDENAAYDKSAKKLTVKGVVKESQSCSVSTFGENGETLHFSITSHAAANTTLEDYMDKMLKSWGGYSNIKITDKGITTVNNRQWGLLKYKSEGSDAPISMYTTLYEGRMVVLTCSTKDKTVLKNYESLLNTVQFNKK